MASDITLQFNDLLKDAVSGLPETVQIRVKEALLITEDLDTEVDQAASWFGYYAVLAEKAAYRLLKMELAFKMWRHDRAAEKRTELAGSGKKAWTQAQMTNYLNSLANHQAFEVQITEYTYERDVLRQIASAFEMKKDLIQTKAANRRGERRP